MSKLIKLLALLLLAWMFGPALAAADSPRVMDRSFDNAKSVRIDLVSGDCSIHAARDRQVRVRNETTLPPERYRPGANLEEGVVRVKEEFPGSGWKRGRVKWDVWVPKGMAVKFCSASGDLEGKDLENALQVRSASGDVNLEKMTGELVVQTASGDIGLEGYTGKVEIRTASGDVEVSGGKVELSVKCASGDIELKRLSGTYSIHTASGDVEMKEIQGSGAIRCASGEIELKGLSATGEWEISAASGEIAVALAAPLTDNMTLSAATGSVCLDTRGQPLKGTIELLAAVNRGHIRSGEKGARDTVVIKGTRFDRLMISRGESPRIRLQSHSGTVELRR